MFVFMNIQPKADGYAWVKNSAFTFITNQDSLNPDEELVLNRLLIQVAPGYPKEGTWTIPVLSPLFGQSVIRGNRLAKNVRDRTQ